MKWHENDVMALISKIVATINQAQKPESMIIKLTIHNKAAIKLWNAMEKCNKWRNVHPGNVVENGTRFKQLARIKIQQSCGRVWSACGIFYRIIDIFSKTWPVDILSKALYRISVI